ncbi:hypothetical protein [Streptomyces sp. E-08]|uniref:hypothetical protein n=1 Tax=Streptomyces sp. E-08 TaxID=3404047 RepID=UPI003CF5182F
MTQATVVEVCGPFLDLAARLAVKWDGLPDGLPAHLLRLTAGIGTWPNPRARPADYGAHSGPAPSERLPAS